MLVAHDFGLDFKLVNGTRISGIKSPKFAGSSRNHFYLSLLNLINNRAPNVVKIRDFVFLWKSASGFCYS